MHHFGKDCVGVLLVEIVIDFVPEGCPVLVQAVVILREVDARAFRKADGVQVEIPAEREKEIIEAVYTCLGLKGTSWLTLSQF